MSAWGCIGAAKTGPTLSDVFTPLASRFACTCVCVCVPAVRSSAACGCHGLEREAPCSSPAPPLGFPRSCKDLASARRSSPGWLAMGMSERSPRQRSLARLSACLPPYHTICEHTSWLRVGGRMLDSQRLRIYRVRCCSLNVILLVRWL